MEVILMYNNDYNYGTIPTFYTNDQYLTKMASIARAVTMLRNGKNYLSQVPNAVSTRVNAAMDNAYHTAYKYAPKQTQYAVDAYHRLNQSSTAKNLYRGYRKEQKFQNAHTNANSYTSAVNATSNNQDKSNTNQLGAVKEAAAGWMASKGKRSVQAWRTAATNRSLRNVARISSKNKGVKPINNKVANNSLQYTPQIDHSIRSMYPVHQHTGSSQRALQPITRAKIPYGTAALAGLTSAGTAGYYAYKNDKADVNN